MVGIQADAQDAGKAKGADKAVRKEAGRLTKLQEELERLEARCGHSVHPPSMVLLSALLHCCFISTVLLAPMWSMTGSIVAVVLAPSDRVA